MDSRGANICAGVDTIATLHVAEVITEKIIRELLKSFSTAVPLGIEHLSLYILIH